MRHEDRRNIELARESAHAALDTAMTAYNASRTTFYIATIALALALSACGGLLWAVTR